jgi:alpha-1,2-mannosyltransferase
MTRPKPATVLLAAAAIALLAALFALKISGGMADFEVNYKAGNRLWTGETLYRTADSHWQFKYSPFSALVYLPLSALPLPAAKAIWFALVILSIGTIVALGRATVASGSGARTRAIVLLSFLVLAKLFLREVQLGQINAVITALLMGMTALIVRDDNGASPSSARQISAGLLWGLAAALKPYALIFLPYFILKGKWRTLASGAAVIAFSLGVPSLFYGIPGNLNVIREWITSLSRSTPGLLAAQDNVSLLAFLMKWTNGAAAASLIYGLGVAILAALTLLFLSRGRGVPRAAAAESALLLVFIPLISPLGWDYTFLSAFAAVVIVVDRMGAFPKPARIFLAVNFLVVALALYDLLGRRFYAEFMSWSIPTLNFLIVAGALFHLRWKRSA